MSLETLISDLTAQMKRVGDLLEVSNAARADLLAKNGVSTPSPAPTDDGMSVAEIKEAVKTADLATLKTMLTDEQNGKARKTAVDAIEAAIEAATPKAEEPAAEQPKAEEPAAEQPKAEEPAAEQPKAEEPVKDQTPSAGGAILSGDEAAKAFGTWFSETDDEAERNNRRAFVQEIVKHLGKRVSELDEAGRQKAIFFLRRKQAGIEVDFNAAYDFAGDPQQSVGGAAVEDDLL